MKECCLIASFTKQKATLGYEKEDMGPASRVFALSSTDPSMIPSILYDLLCLPGMNPQH